MTVLPQAAALAFVLAVLFVRLLAKGPFGGWGLDQPNDRSLHVTPVPRNGGLGLFAAAGLTWALFAGGAVWPAVALAGGLLLISLADDVRGLPVSIRFGAQLAAAVLLLYAYTIPWVLVPLLILGIVWMTNLYNFMDGSNGLAGGMAVIGFAGTAAAAHLMGAPDIALVATLIAAAALGFLVWNFGRAIVFMGDAGAIPLGFLAAALGIIGLSRGAWSLAVPLMLFAPFIADATVTLLRRFLRGENLAQAHRSHLYQRIIQAGWSHQGTALVAYAAMVVCAGAAVATLGQPELLQWAVLGAVGIGLVLCGVVGEVYIARRTGARIVV